MSEMALEVRPYDIVRSSLEGRRIGTVLRTSGRVATVQFWGEIGESQVPLTTLDGIPVQEDLAQDPLVDRAFRGLKWPAESDGEEQREAKKMTMSTEAQLVTAGGPEGGAEALVKTENPLLALPISEEPRRTLPDPPGEPHGPRGVWKTCTNPQCPQKDRLYLAPLGPQGEKRKYCSLPCARQHQAQINRESHAEAVRMAEERPKVFEEQERAEREEEAPPAASRPGASVPRSAHDGPAGAPLEALEDLTPEVLMVMKRIVSTLERVLGVLEAQVQLTQALKAQQGEIVKALDDLGDRVDLSEMDAEARGWRFKALEKLPTFNPNWSALAISEWLQALSKIVQILERQYS